jgi:hypothetical protein
MATASAKQKHMGTHVIGPRPVAAVGRVAGAPLTPPVWPFAKTMPIPKQRMKKPVTKPPTVKKPAVTNGSLTAINVATLAALVAGGTHTREVFAKMPERYISLFLSGELDCLPRCGELDFCVLRCSQGSDSFMGMLNKASVDIDQEPLGDYKNGHIGVYYVEDVEEVEALTHMKMPQAKKKNT